jgi:hypothetical protein
VTTKISCRAESERLAPRRRADTISSTVSQGRKQGIEIAVQRVTTCAEEDGVASAEASISSAMASRRLGSSVSARRPSSGVSNG